MNSERVTRREVLIKGLVGLGLPLVIAGCDRVSPSPVPPAPTGPRPSASPSATTGPEVVVVQTPTVVRKIGSPTVAPEALKPTMMPSVTDTARPSVVSATKAPEPSATPTGTLIPLNELPPVPTAESINQTPTIAAAGETVSLPWGDNFNNGVSDAWVGLNGTTPHALDGALIGESRDGNPTIIAGEKSNWTNYVVDADVNKSSGRTFEVMVRVSERNDSGNPEKTDVNFIGLQVENNGDLAWRDRLDGRDNQIAREPKPQNYKQPTGPIHIRVVAQGDMFTAILSDGRTTSISDKRFPKGGIGLSYNGGDLSFDNVAVTPLNSQTP